MSGRLHKPEPLAVVASRTPTIDPKRHARIVDILLDIIDTSKRLDVKTNPEEGHRP